MTFNLQTDLPYYYGDLLFKNRFRSILAIIRYYNPDIIGVQELSEDMLPMLDELNDTYVFYGHSRNRQSAFANERCCIYTGRTALQHRREKHSGCPPGRIQPVLENLAASTRALPQDFC